MSSYSTGVVGASHRAVMHEGAVIAVAETVTLASVIVRALNDQQIDEDTKLDIEPWSVDIAGMLHDGWVDQDNQESWAARGMHPVKAGSTFRRLYVEREEVR